MSVFKVTGSWGELIVDKNNGLVLDYDDQGNCEPGEEGYANIKRFDVTEYKEHYGELSDTDILLIGYWDKDGTYEPPVEEWRNHKEPCDASIQ